MIASHTSGPATGQQLAAGNGDLRGSGDKRAAVAPAGSNAPQAAPTAPPRLWLTGELASAARLHPESVRRCIRQGRIVAIRFGRSLRIADAVAQEILAKGLPA